ncbi:radical SAM protein [Reyranella sp.]|jgi:MoaA/NifB/PqqE/SkfB family radical SAM enzyme|uniref:radical SAM protein n=1 Tax=Reyranella sp. TaxID=1929291 RepID=UPI002F9320F9
MTDVLHARSRRATEAEALERLTKAPFTPNSHRGTVMDFNGFATTETCELSCVFCHFNGPNAIKKARTLDPEMVRKGLEQVPSGQKVHFAATGDFFQDPHALDHLRKSIDLGHPVNVLSHGQSMPPERLDEMLAMGVREFRFSVDHIDARQYAKIRRGGELERVLQTIDYLRQRKGDLPDISVEINCILIGDTKDRMQEFADFWSNRVDAIHFHAEYYDVLKFRNLFFIPEQRNDCHIQLYVLPSGQIAPCCAMMVQAHEGDASWLPNIADVSLQDAYDRLCDMYEDPTSELGKVCSRCQWWVMWTEHRDGCSPYMKSVRFDQPEVTAPASEAAPERKASPVEKWLHNFLESFRHS